MTIIFLPYGLRPGVTVKWSTNFLITNYFIKDLNKDKLARGKFWLYVNRRKYYVFENS